LHLYLVHKKSKRKSDAIYLVACKKNIDWNLENASVSRAGERENGKDRDAREWEFKQITPVMCPEAVEIPLDLLQPPSRTDTGNASAGCTLLPLITTAAAQLHPPAGRPASVAPIGFVEGIDRDGIREGSDHIASRACVRLLRVYFRGWLAGCSDPPRFHVHFPQGTGRYTATHGAGPDAVWAGAVPLTRAVRWRASG
jgi:hypothetical protein